MEVGKSWDEDMELESGGTKSMGRCCYVGGLKELKMFMDGALGEGLGTVEESVRRWGWD